MARNATGRRRQQARRALDRRFAQAPGLPAVLAVPRGGWVRTIREALGMSAGELGQRMGVHQTTVSAVERNEVAARVQLGTLVRAADALGCDLVYALVPRKPLQAMVEDRALEVAAAALATVEHTMRMEDQGVDQAVTADQVHDRAHGLRDEPGLWAQQP